MSPCLDCYLIVLIILSRITINVFITITVTLISTARNPAECVMQRQADFVSCLLGGALLDQLAKKVKFCAACLLLPRFGL